MKNLIFLLFTISIAGNVVFYLLFLRQVRELREIKRIHVDLHGESSFENIIKGLSHELNSMGIQVLAFFKKNKGKLQIEADKATIPLMKEGSAVKALFLQKPYHGDKRYETDKSLMEHFGGQNIAFIPVRAQREQPCWRTNSCSDRSCRCYSKNNACCWLESEKNYKGKALPTYEQKTAKCISCPSLLPVGVFAVKDTSSRKLSKATSFINDNFRGIIKNSLKCESALVNAATDFLTGIANKETLLRELEALFKMADRYKHDLSLCFFGVDHFKLFNDAYGHPAGDAILRELAKRVSSAVRKTDIVARYGGEKFCIVFPMTDKKTAISVAEKIRAQVEHTRFTTPEGPLPVRISMGVASFPIDTIADVQTLIDKADRALLHAKKTRNKAVGYADSMTTLPKKEIKRGQGQLRRQEK